MTIADLLARATAAEPSRPALTFYDLTTGERVELSLTTCTNWVAKTANMLQDTLGCDDDTTVDVLLPLHWETAVWFLAAWVAGATVSLRPGDALAVVDPSTLDAADGAEDIVALSLRPLGGRFTTPLPAGVIDYNAEVPSHGDHFTAYYPPAGASPALVADDSVLTHADLTSRAADTYAPGARVMIVGDRDLTPLVEALPAALHAHGSLVLVRTPTPDEHEDRIAAIAETERVTVR
ncbi:TIGR03089 family protein [Mumia zhuanghuii]|uniref:TIGR03089 family protein n=1 Tax=Mumia zhuanghuii TaxID=2585211 RepID=A0A5C4MAA2_9ACTN|nr:TIGR03089 family protein [Mumia zhuanghuii]TNC31221.1 TIGR03089 family protein [Mumia zhuanghuii]TNC44918.1 TIGR03089 family protein [Mumia zhuanghuii]